MKKQSVKKQSVKKQSVRVDKIIIPVIRRLIPDVIARDIVDVQPMGWTKEDLWNRCLLIEALALEEGKP